MFSEIPSPGGGQNRMKLTKAEYLKGTLGFLFLMGLIVLYAFEFKYFSNTLEVKSLVVRSLLFGFLIGGVAAYFFTKDYTDLLERLKVSMFFIILIPLFMPLFGSLSNRLLSFEEKEKTEVEVFAQQVYGASRFGNVKGQINKDGYYLFFIKDSKVYRVKTKNLLFPNAQKGDRVTVNFKKGFWGYEYFLEK